MGCMAMFDNSSNDSIIHFVRNTLGCQCADEVFRTIELDSGSTPDGKIRFRKVVIGKRLLIYLVSAMPPGRARSLLPVLAEMGKLERNKRGYNRFRLVVAARADEVEMQAAMDEFQESMAVDGKAHMHFISPNELPDIPETGA